MLIWIGYIGDMITIWNITKKWIYIYTYHITIHYMDNITIWKIYCDPYIGDIIPYGSPQKNWKLPRRRPPIPSTGGQGEVHGRPVQCRDVVLTREKNHPAGFLGRKMGRKCWQVLENSRNLGPRFLFFSVWVRCLWMESSDVWDIIQFSPSCRCFCCPRTRWWENWNRKPLYLLVTSNNHGFRLRCSQPMDWLWGKTSQNYWICSEKSGKGDFQQQNKHISQRCRWSKSSPLIYHNAVVQV
jgi:hypothetical protein